MKQKALKAAFPHTIPILTGYLFLGMAYGFLMHIKGFGVGLTALTSAVVFAGAMQYAGVTLLTSAFHPLYALLLTLIINARHIFYGIAMLEKYKDAGKLKPFLIFGLVDETFSINCANQPPEGVDRKWFYFFVTLLNYIYWLASSIAGNVIGNFITFKIEGVEFVLTALFVVIFIDQWTENKKHGAALTGLLCSAACLIIFGSEHFLIPAMILIVLTLTIFKKHIEKETQ